MSISSARSFLEKSGCGWIVSIFLGIVIIFGLIVTYYGQRGQREQGDRKPAIIALVGSQPVTLESVRKEHDGAVSQLLNQPGGMPPERDAEIFAEALDRQIRTSGQYEVAARQGVTVTKQKVLDDQAKIFDAQIQYQKMLLMQSGQVKQNATEAEANQALTKMLGKDVSQARKDYLASKEKDYEDPVQRLQMESQTLSGVLIDSVSARITLTDEQLKKDLEKFVTKRVAFSMFSHPKEDLEAKADKVLSEIKSGKITFEQAMEQYSDDPKPAADKPKSDATVNLTRANMSYDDSYKPLRDLKPGNISPVVKLNTGPAIFKIVGIDTKPPTDFETTKNDLRKNRIREMAIKQIQKQIDDLVKGGALKWESPGFEVMYKWLVAFRDTDLAKDKAKLEAKMTELATEAKKVVEQSDPVGDEAAVLTWYTALKKAYDDATPDKKKGFQTQFLDAATAVLEAHDNVALRLDVVRAYLDLKKLDEAGTNLAAASQANSDTDETGLKNYQAIEALKAKLAAQGWKPTKELTGTQDMWKTQAYETLRDDAQYNEDYSDSGKTKWAEDNTKIAGYAAAGILTAAQVKEIQGFQDKWKVAKAKADDELAKQRKQVEEAAKKTAEEAKKKTAATPSGTPPPKSTPPSKPSKPSKPSSADLFGGKKG